jgi:hypothetical protein
MSGNLKERNRLGDSGADEITEKLNVSVWAGNWLVQGTR